MPDVGTAPKIRNTKIQKLESASLATAAMVLRIFGVPGFTRQLFICKNYFYVQIESMNYFWLPNYIRWMDFNK